LLYRHLTKKRYSCRFDALCRHRRRARFIEASNKAKIHETPRVIGSYESSQLADYVRGGRVEVTRVGELVGDTAAVGGK
jgi:hypothetical protein